MSLYMCVRQCPRVSVHVFQAVSSCFCTCVSGSVLMFLYMCFRQCPHVSVHVFQAVSSCFCTCVSGSVLMSLYMCFRQCPHVCIHVFQEVSSCLCTCVSGSVLTSLASLYVMQLKTREAELALRHASHCMKRSHCSMGAAQVLFNKGVLR